MGFVSAAMPPPAGIPVGFSNHLQTFPVSGPGGKVPAGKDSISIWSALKSGGPSPRSEVLLQLAGPDATTGLQEKDAAIRIGPWKLIINVDGRDRCPNSANVSGMSGDAQQNSCFYSNSGWMAMLP